MTTRNALKMTLTSTFTVPAPTNDELIELAMDAGIEGDDPTEAELDEAYENWKEQVSEKFEEGEAPIPDGAHSDIEVEEVSK